MGVGAAGTAQRDDQLADSGSDMIRGGLIRGFGRLARVLRRHNRWAQ
jgi:hypothetical protein